MTKTILFALLLISAVACKKDKTHPSININSGTIIGKWDLVLMTGGFAGVHETATQWGHHASYTFRTDSICQCTVDTSNTYEPYSIQTDSLNVTSLLINGSKAFILGSAHDTLTMYNDMISDATTDWYTKE